MANEIKEYIIELERYKDIAVKQFGDVSDLERDTIDRSFEWLAENLQLSEGEVLIAADIIEVMNKFVAELIKIINANESYQSMVHDFMSNIQTIGDNLLTFHKEVNQLNVGNRLKPVQKVLVDGVIDALTDNGLNTHFAIPLKDVIYRNILSGMSLKQAKKYLGDYILSGADGKQTGTNVKGAPGKLSRYLTQTAQIGVDTYTGVINTQLYKLFTFTGFIMSGSLIETSSKQCKEGIHEAEHGDPGGYLTNAQIDDLLKIAAENKAALLIEGTTKENLDQNKFHWGCRHEFTPYIKKDVQSK